MPKTLSRRALTCASAVVFVAGCSGGPTSLAPSGQPAAQSSARQSQPGLRMLPGPAVAGPIFVPRIVKPARVTGVRPGKSAAVLYVADPQGNKVLTYDPKTPNPSPNGSVTTGIDTPAGLAVDKSGTLYVANLGNNTITVYPAGQSSPSLTISSGVDGPYGLGVDSKGDIFISNLNNNTVVGYKAGQTAPFETVTGFDNPVGVAVDSKNNVYVACDSNNTVYVIPAGSSQMQSAGLTGLSGPIGLAFEKKDTLYVSNFAANNIAIYPSGQTSPSGTLTTDVNSPTLSGFAKKNVFFQAQQSGTVIGFKSGQTSPFSTITGNPQPLGVASFPLEKK
jgi:streptogramin lyase